MSNVSDLGRLSFSFSTELRDSLEKEAHKELRTLPSYIKRILNDHLEKTETKNKKKE